MAKRSGFDVAKVIPVTTVFEDVSEADKIFGIYRLTERAVAAGYMEADAAQVLINYLAIAPFFASVTLFITIGSIPREEKTVFD
nr:hypothetical protein [Paenibacillus donghaensis]